MISIVTPVLDDERVARAAGSVQVQQVDGGVEHIIVDGGSSPVVQHLLDDLERTPSVKVLRGPDRGIYDGMNRGIEAASGVLLGVLNSDDCYEDPFVLRDVSRAYLEGGSPIVYGDVLYVTKHGRIVRYWRSGRPTPWRIHTGWIPPHPAVFVARTAFETCGVFDLRYRLAADYEFLLRALLRYGLEVSYVPRLIGRMELGGASNRSPMALLEGAREVRAAWRANGLRGGHLAPIGKPIRKLPQLVMRPRITDNRAGSRDHQLWS